MAALQMYQPVTGQFILFFSREERNKILALLDRSFI